MQHSVLTFPNNYLLLKGKKGHDWVIITGLIQSWNAFAEIIFCHFIFAIVTK